MRTTLALVAAAIALLVPASAHAAVPGVNIHGFPTDESVREAIATGARTVRMNLLWSDVEPGGPGTWHGGSSPSIDQAIRTLNAAGARPLFAISGAPPQVKGGIADPLVPPADPATYADFLGRFAAHNAAQGDVAGYEVWNEPDESEFWHPGADNARYAALLRAAYPAIKAADPDATVVAGATTGNNYDWIEGLYANGAGASFDAAGVHTDTACLDRGPDQFYRENGRIARFTFLGYRTVRDTMAAHGQSKPIWMTELGWSSTNGGPSSCGRGQWAGQKPSGVSDADQAAYLTAAYRCLANDPYVEQALWFTLRDDPAAPFDELRHYGLLTAGGAPKPSYAAFRAVAAAGGGAGGPCGDFDAPALRIVKPAPGERFVDRLDVQAAARDGGVGLQRITFAYDDGTTIRHFNDLANDRAVGLAPWWGSASLPLGRHTITVLAIDRNGNARTASVVVEKVKTLKATLTPRFRMRRGGTVRCVTRRCTIAGALSRGVAGSPTIGGHVAVEWEFLNAKRKWRRLSGGLSRAHKPFTFTAKLTRAGRWRVRVVYRGQAPWRKVATPYRTFRLR